MFLIESVAKGFLGLDDVILPRDKLRNMNYVKLQGQGIPLSPCSVPSFLSFGSKGDTEYPSDSGTLEVGPEGERTVGGARQCAVLEKAQAFFSGDKAYSENYTAEVQSLQGLLTHQ